jgi:hypothetical protein
MKRTSKLQRSKERRANSGPLQVLDSTLEIEPPSICYEVSPIVLLRRPIKRTRLPGGRNAIRPGTEQDPRRQHEGSGTSYASSFACYVCRFIVRWLAALLSPAPIFRAAVLIMRFAVAGFDRAFTVAHLFLCAAAIRLRAARLRVRLRPWPGAAACVPSPEPSSRRMSPSRRFAAT